MFGSGEFTTSGAGPNFTVTGVTVPFPIRTCHQALSRSSVGQRVCTRVQTTFCTSPLRSSQGTPRRDLLISVVYPFKRPPVRVLFLIWCFRQRYCPFNLKRRSFEYSRICQRAGIHTD